MRPLVLELRGFGPYLEAQRVDFSDVELFAITGPTGSGKTTLLDAMAFALYARTPRLGAQGLGELRHPSAQEAYVALTFQVKDRVYRVERVRGRRGEARLFLLEPEERLLPTESLQALNQRVAEIVGLSYEAFTRALLLPQGEFDRFLRGEAQERRRLLMGLFGLDLLERIRERARGHQDQLLKDYQALEGELRGLEGASPEAKEALEGELARLEEEIRALEGEVRAREKEVEAVRRKAEALERYRLAFARWQGVLAREEEMVALRGRLEKAEAAAWALPLWQDLRAKEAAYRKTQEERDRVKARLEALRAAYRSLEGAKETLRLLEEAWAKGERLLLLQSLWRRVGVTHHPHPRYDPEALARVLEGEGPLRALVQAEEEVQRIAQALASAEERMRALLEEGQALKAEVEALGEALRRAQAEAMRRELEALSQEVSRLLARKEALEGEAEALREAELRAGLQAYRHLLRLGEACPLCGQKVLALPPLEPTPTHGPQLKAVEENLKEVVENLARLEAERKHLAKALEDLGVEPGPGDPEALAQRLKEKEGHLQALREAYREAQGQHQALKAEEERARARLRGAQEAALKVLGTLPEDPQAFLARLEEEKEALAAGLYAHLQEATQGQPLEAYLEGLRARLERVRAEVDEALALEGKLAALEKEAVGLEARLEEQEKALLEARARTQGLLPEAEAQEAFLEEGAREALAQRLQAYAKERAEAEREWAMALEALRALGLEGVCGGPGGHPEQEAYRELRAQEAALEGLRRALDHKREERGRLKEKKRLLEEALARRKVLEARRAEVVGELGLWERLLLDLRADRFPDFLLDHRQKSLLNRANELLQVLAQGRYRLGVREGSYVVLDLWTEAERGVQTLSGGEAFLVSLALALALSEELSRGRLGAFFLDEGFGTLDAETLEVVAGVLESLPTQGRLVGIVTHVEALAERLPARLRVHKSPKGSWAVWD